MRRALFIAAALGALTWAGAAQAGTFALTGADLSYVAPSGETNRVFLIHEEKPVRGFRLIDAGAPVTAGASCSSLGPNEAFCPTPDSVDHVLVSVDDEDDYVNTSASSSVTRLEGGDGNDALYSGFNSSATLEGGLGADVLSGEGATADYSARTNPLTVTMGDGLANDGESGEHDLIANDVRGVLGGSGADTYTLTGTDALRLVDAGAGIDHLVAIGSNNCGLFGGPGNDQIEADHSHCGLSGGGDNDTIVGGDGRQFLDGGEGNDLLRAGPGPDSIAGEGGADEIVGGTGRDHMRGGSGDDTFRTKDGAEDFIDGNQGIDRAHADKGLDELHDIEQLF